MVVVVVGTAVGTAVMAAMAVATEEGTHEATPTTERVAPTTEYQVRYCVGCTLRYIQVLLSTRYDTAWGVPCGTSRYY